MDTHTIVATGGTATCGATGGDIAGDVMLQLLVEVPQAWLVRELPEINTYHQVINLLHQP